MRFKPLSAELRYYKRCESNVKSIAGLLDTINEFMKYCVTPQMLEKAAELEKNDDVLNAKFHELSVIYAKFCQMLSSEYCDSSAVCRKGSRANKARL